MPAGDRWGLPAPRGADPVVMACCSVPQPALTPAIRIVTATAANRREATVESMGEDAVMTVTLLEPLMRSRQQ